MSENQVGQIFKHAFKELYLVHINLSHNKISYIEKESFVNCANISVLDLSHNRLSSYHLQSAFDENTYATELQLSYNNFTDLSQVYFLLTLSSDSIEFNSKYFNRDL